jgi:UDP-N-acetyl-D-glucosamine dehydrogenase
MPAHVVGRVTEALNERSLPLRGARVLVYGVAYKPNVADTRESPGIEILALLARRGAAVAYADPFVPRLRTPELALESIDVSSGFSGWDAVVVVTDHAALDRDRLLADAALVVDPRGALRNKTARPGALYGL